MIAAGTIWLCTISLIVTAAIVYLAAPGLGVLVFIVGMVALVVLGDRAQRREQEMLEVQERLRDAARRLP